MTVGPPVPPELPPRAPLASWDDRTFRSTVEVDGLTVQVTINVNAERLGDDVFECGETAAMTATRVAVAAQRHGGVPFERPVPF